MTFDDVAGIYDLLLQATRESTSLDEMEDMKYMHSCCGFPPVS